MIILLGASGYVGSAILRELQSRNWPVLACNRKTVDLTSRREVRRLFEEHRPKFVINAVGYTGRPNIDATEQDKLRTFSANLEIPVIVSEVLRQTDVPWGHVSSGCIYQGSRPGGGGFREDDPPNFGLADPLSSFYAHTKAMAERILLQDPNCRIWRLRIPFDQYDHERNYLSKLMRYERLLDAENSISHLGDFAWACAEMVERRAPAGIYNVTNPGSITTRQVVAQIAKHQRSNKVFVFYSDEADFLQKGQHIRRASCILDTMKLSTLGIKLRSVEEAVHWSLAHWVEQPCSHDR